MQTFKTSKCELIFISLPKDAYDVHMVEDLGHTFVVFKRPNRPLDNIEITEGYTLIGKLSTIPEDVAKGLVGMLMFKSALYSKEESRSIRFSIMCDTYKEHLECIATHLGMNTNDNIYLLKKI